MFLSFLFFFAKIFFENLETPLLFCIPDSHKQRASSSRHELFDSISFAKRQPLFPDLHQKNYFYGVNGHFCYFPFQKMLDFTRSHCKNFRQYVPNFSSSTIAEVSVWRPKKIAIWKRLAKKMWAFSNLNLLKFQQI